MNTDVDGWVARMEAGGDVGATQQGRIEIPAGEEHWEYVAMDGTGGSPRRGQDEGMDGEIDTGDGDSGWPGKATRSGQNFVMEEGGELPDKAAIEMGGSPVHKREKGDIPYAGGVNIV